MAAERVAISMIVLGAIACAQDVRVYSEFTRIDPFGAIVRADRGANPREILSPAVLRNAFSTFRVVVSGEPGMAYALYAGQNPENAVNLTMYREVYVKSGDEWIPDGLEKVELPFEGIIGSKSIPGQTAQSFLMDLRVDRNAPVRRIKVEPELLVAGRWITYPMEVRVVAAVVAQREPVHPALPDAAQPSDASVAAVYSAAACQAPTKPSDPLPSVRAIIARNASQDIALAGTADRSAWCHPYKAHDEGPEWYLRFRDRLRHARQ